VHKELAIGWGHVSGYGAQYEPAIQIHSSVAHTESTSRVSVSRCRNLPMLLCLELIILTIITNTSLRVVSSSTCTHIHMRA
jgi:hypothetical protein